ncbi:hypothetical protein GCM10010353_31710 [Streptomyces chryseus]|nr:hypothetical protein GCM10010353_31710 [Streptomyces chryseus]
MAVAAWRALVGSGVPEVKVSRDRLLMGDAWVMVRERQAFLRLASYVGAQRGDLALDERLQAVHVVRQVRNAR